ncbi:LemA family protein [Mycoplasma sp. 4423]
MANLVNNREAHHPDGFQPNVDSRPTAATTSTASKVIFWILGILLLFSGVIYYFVKRNSFNRMQLQTNESASTIDVFLTQRYDTLNKLVEITKSYSKYENETLTQIAKMRSLVSQGGVANANEIEKLNTSVFGRLMAVSEAYPELKAMDAYKELMNQSTYLERELQAARRLYNKDANIFNKEIFTYPASIIAAMLKLETLPLYAASEQQKQDVSMKGLF